MPLEDAPLRFTRQVHLRLHTAHLKPESLDAYKKHVPEFTIIAAPGFNASPLIDSTRTETFIILNLAVGGNYVGDPDGTTVFPQTLLVDYVRVYQVAS